MAKKHSVKPPKVPPQFTADGKRFSLDKPVWRIVLDTPSMQTGVRRPYKWVSVRRDFDKTRHWVDEKGIVHLTPYGETYCGDFCFVEVPLSQCYSSDLAAREEIAKRALRKLSSAAADLTEAHDTYCEAIVALTAAEQEASPES